MIFAFLTLLSALSLASVAGWFSIVGIMSIYAGAPMAALVMGTVLEGGKLVTTSWLYRNWEFSSWKLKIPLIIFTIVLMITTSIGVFGFLSKAHLQQGASTINNSDKIQRLDEQIAHEKSVIDDNRKVIEQLDATINSYLGKDRTDRSLSVRRSQAPQRKQLRDEIEEAQKRIDAYSEQKISLQSEVKQLQLEVGPIRYISELFYGSENTDKNIESAVRMFTLLIVSTLDPLAIILLIAANHSIMRRKNEKDEPQTPNLPPQVGGIVSNSKFEDNTEENNTGPVELLHKPEEHESGPINLGERLSNEDAEVPSEIFQTSEEKINEKTEDHEEQDSEISTGFVEHAFDEQEIFSSVSPDFQTKYSTTVEKSATLPPVLEVKAPWAQQEHVLRELLGTSPHFIPKKLSESETDNENNAPTIGQSSKYPRALSWLGEFKRSQ